MNGPDGAAATGGLLVQLAVEKFQAFSVRNCFESAFRQQCLLSPGIERVSAHMAPITNGGEESPATCAQDDKSADPHVCTPGKVGVDRR